MSDLGMGNLRLPKGTSATIVIGGIQGGFTTKDNQGFYGNMILGDNSYLSYTSGKTEVRGVPLKDMTKVPLDGSQPKYGDYAPQLRVLHQVGVYRGVPIQAEIALGSKPSVGLRAKIETPKNIAGYDLPFSVEVAAGARLTLKVPGLISAIFK